MKRTLVKLCALILVLSFALTCSSCGIARVGMDLLQDKLDDMEREQNAISEEEFLSYFTIVELNSENIGEYMTCVDSVYDDVGSTISAYCLKEGWWPCIEDEDGRGITGTVHYDLKIYFFEDQWSEKSSKELNFRSDDHMGEFSAFEYFSVDGDIPSNREELLSVSFEGVKGRIFKVELPEEVWIREEATFPYFEVKRSDGKGYYHISYGSNGSFLNSDLAKLLWQILDGVPAEE